MQVNLNTNHQTPQFGMAFIKPKTIEDTRALAKYIGANSKVCARGLKQLVNEQKGLVFYDIKYNPKGNSFDIIEKSSNRVVDSYDNVFGNSTGFDIFGETDYHGRKFFARFFNPKKFLPKSLFLAGEKAKKLEKIALVFGTDVINALNKAFE